MYGINDDLLKAIQSLYAESEARVRVNISLNDSRMEADECYKYFGVDILNDGRMNEEVRHRIGEARKHPKHCKSFGRIDACQMKQKWQCMRK